jgi:hypothetical protein
MGTVQKIEQDTASPAPVVITPAAMIQQAIAQGSGVEVMERLLALQERYDAFNARKAFDDAMADLRKNLPRIVKSREVDFTNKNGGGRTHYKFEDLAEITEALAEPMSQVGLSFRWYTDNVQGGVKVTCRITHRDGHYEETSLVGPLDASGNKNPIQAIGSAVSYLQRYTLKAAVGVAAAHDDDAQAVSQKREAAPRQQRNFGGAAPTHADRLREAKSEADLEAAWNQIRFLPEEELPQSEFDALHRLHQHRLSALRKSAHEDRFPGFVDPNAQFDRMEAGQ